MVDRRLPATRAIATGMLERRRALVLLPAILLALLCGLELGAILRLNDGVFVYALDDPYIHLDLASRLATDGHYGVNAGEPASPSSSILWPFLLVPLVWLGLGQWGPLLLNLSFALLALGVADRLADRILPPVLDRRALYRAALTVAAIPAFNLVGLCFIGMEHSLQILCCLTAALGLIDAGPRRLPWPLLVAIVAGPLVRYENLAISAAALLVIARHGHRGAALAAGAVVLATVGGFSLYLLALGMPPLPASVLLKSTVGGGSLLHQRLVYLAVKLLDYPPVTLLATLGIAAAWQALDGRRAAPARWLAAAALLVVAAQFAAGRFDWLSRYEVYAVAFVTPLLLHGGRAALARLLGSSEGRPLAAHVGAAVGLVLGVIAVFGVYAFNGILRTPLAAHSIYVQQYQMHRFVADYWRGPVAVNDIGLVGMDNPEFVLDLWGLASIDAARARRRNEPGWMNRLMRMHGVRLAMIYADADWLGPWLPRGWIEVASLEADVRFAAFGGARVGIFTPDPDAVPAIRAALQPFAATLPSDARLTFR